MNNFKTHIDSKGNEYPILTMDNNHLKNLINLHLRKINFIDNVNNDPKLQFLTRKTWSVSEETISMQKEKIKSILEPYINELQRRATVLNDETAKAIVIEYYKIVEPYMLEDFTGYKAKLLSINTETENDNDNDYEIEDMIDNCFPEF